MKKYLALILAICMIFTLCACGQQAATTETPTETAAEENQDVDAETSANTTTTAVDYDSIYALHDPSEVVMTVNGREVTWGEYFYWYYTYASQIEQMILYYPMYYGVEVKWDDVCDAETGDTYAQIPALAADQQAKIYAGVFEYSKENGIDFDDECEQKYQETIQSNMTAAEIETEEEFFKALEGIYVSRSMFDTQVKASILNEKAYIEKYGVDGADLPADEAIKYLEDNNYMHAMHILFKNTNSETGEALSDEENAANKAQAEKLVEELKAITDNTKRKEKFEEFAEKYNQDGRSEYTFTEGEMVSAFEEGVKALSDYDVDLVETQYGYHIIMRLPLDPDMTVTDGSNIRTKAADALFEEILQEYLEGLEVKYVNNFTAPVLTDYIIET